MKLFKRKEKETIHTLSESLNDDALFRSIGVPAGQKGLNQLSRDTQMQLAFNLWLRNGFAKRILEVIVEFIIGDSIFNIDISNKEKNFSEKKKKEVMRVIEEFKEENKLEDKFEKFVLDLFLNGMLVNPVFVNVFNGKVKIGFTDAQQIDKIVTNPYDVTEFESIKFKSNFLGENKELSVIKKKPFLPKVSETEIKNPYPGQEFLQGECFYTAINNVSNQPEGISELFANINLIEAFSDLLFNVVDSTNLANFFVLDVELANANEDKIKAWAKANPMPKRPTRFVHNEKVKQEAFSPNLTQINNSDTIRVVKNTILGNYGYPAHWFADGTSTNRSTAFEQNDPILKRLKKKQRIAVNILESMYTFVLHCAVLYKEQFPITAEELANTKITVNPPELDTRNYKDLSEMFGKVVENLVKAEDRKWISKDSARKVFLSQLQSTGNVLDIEGEEQKIKSETEIEGTEKKKTEDIIPKEDEGAEEK